MGTYKRKDIYKMRADQISHGRPWSQPEIEEVITHAGKIKAKLIARIIDRSYESLRQMAKRNGISLRLN